MVDEKVSWMKKFGMTPEKSDDASREDLSKKIENEVSNHSHFDQMSRGRFNLMRDADGIYQITRKFKQNLFGFFYGGYSQRYLC